METPAPTAMENNNNLKLNIDSDEYQLMFYIERSKLVFKLQNGDNNPDKIFQKDFLLNELKQLNPAFRGFDNLEDAVLVRHRAELLIHNEWSGEINRQDFKRFVEEAQEIINEQT